MAKPRENKKRDKTKRGATRDSASAKTHAKWVLRSTVVLSLLLGISWSIYQLPVRETYANIKQAIRLPVKSVAIEGDFTKVSRDQIELIVRDSLSKDFLKVELKEIKKKIEEDPWVEFVNVKRIWPDKIELSVNEEKPIARWGDSGFINQHGTLIDVKLDKELDQLPLFYGSNKQIEEITQWYMVAGDILSNYDLNISGLKINEQGDWELAIDNSIQIIMGAEDKQSKLEQFLIVYTQKLKADVTKIAVVDLRYEAGLAVSWRSPNNLIATND